MICYLVFVSCIDVTCWFAKRSCAWRDLLIHNFYICRNSSKFEVLMICFILGDFEKEIIMRLLRLADFQKQTKPCLHLFLSWGHSLCRPFAASSYWIKPWEREKCYTRRCCSYRSAIKKAWYRLLLHLTFNDVIECTLWFEAVTAQPACKVIIFILLLQIVLCMYVCMYECMYVCMYVCYPRHPVRNAKSTTGWTQPGALLHTWRWQPMYGPNPPHSCPHRMLEEQQQQQQQQQHLTPYLFSKHFILPKCCISEKLVTCGVIRSYNWFFIARI